MKNRRLSDSRAIRWLYLVFLSAAIFRPSAGIAWSAEPGSSLAPEDSSLTFVVTADNHSGYNDSQRAVWQAIAPHRGTFAMTAGDVGSASGIRRVIDECLGVTYPWYAAVGNHDLRSDRIAALRALNPGGSSLANIVNPGPPNCEETTYSFRYENCHFVILNPYYDGNSDIGYKTSGANGNAYVCDALYDWLEADLDAARANPKVQHIFVTAHEPLYYATDQDSPLKIDLFNDYDLGRDPQNRDRFRKLLKQKGVVAFFCGHHHVFRAHRTGKDDVWQVVSAWGRGCDPPNASDRWKHVKSTFVKVTVNGNTVNYEAHRGPKYGGPCDVPYTAAHSGTLVGGKSTQPRRAPSSHRRQRDSPQSPRPTRRIADIVALKGKGITLPTLDEALALFVQKKQPNAIVWIDTKDDEDYPFEENQALYDRLIELITKYNVWSEAHIEVSSPKEAEALKLRDSRIRVVFWARDAKTVREALRCPHYLRIGVRPNVAGELHEQIRASGKQLHVTITRQLTDSVKQLIEQVRPSSIGTYRCSELIDFLDVDP